MVGWVDVSGWDEWRMNGRVAKGWWTDEHELIESSGQDIPPPAFLSSLQERGRSRSQSQSLAFYRHLRPTELISSATPLALYSALMYRSPNELVPFILHTHTHTHSR